jgi:hypothetical protein
MFAYRSILREQVRPAAMRRAAPALRDLTASIDALAD